MTVSSSSPATTTPDYEERAVPPRKKPSFHRKLVSGAIAGIVGTCIIYPIDMVKTRLQNQRGTSSVQYKNGFDVVRTIVRSEGGKGLYRGLVPNLVGVTPEKAIKLAVNDYMREALGKRVGSDAENIPLQYGIVAGATAGFCQVVATNPMEMIKIQMQVASLRLAPGEKPKTAWEVTKGLGLKGIYRGTAACLMRDVPFSILFFPSFAILKEYFATTSAASSSSTSATPSSTTSSSSSPSQTFAAGILAGTFAAFLVTPMDVVKTRLQIIHESKNSPSYNGIADCYKQIWRTEGPRAFYRGAIQRCLIIAPLFGISMLTYEVQQKLFS